MNGTYTNAKAVTPHDTAASGDVSGSRGLYVGGAGNLSVTMSHDSDATAVTFTGVAVGVILPIRANRVRATGTTATAIVAVW